MKSLNDLSKNLKTAAPIAGLIIVIVALSIYIFGFGEDPGYSWLGVVPGKTSLEEAKGSLGDPDEEGEISDGQVRLLKYTFESESAKIYFRDGKVVIIKVGGAGIEQRENFDSDLSVFYSTDYRDYVIGLYLDEGRGKVVNELTGLTIENWYFEPAQESEVKSDLSGIDKLDRERPVIF